MTLFLNEKIHIIFIRDGNCSYKVSRCRPMFISFILLHSIYAFHAYFHCSWYTEKVPACCRDDIGEFHRVRFFQLGEKIRRMYHEGGFVYFLLSHRFR
jgi:hypothetical protein